MESLVEAHNEMISPEVHLLGLHLPGRYCARPRPRAASALCFHHVHHVDHFVAHHQSRPLPQRNSRFPGRCLRVQEGS